MKNGLAFIFCFIVVVVWLLVIVNWPRLLLNVYKRAILKKGFGEGPIPVNTLYTEPQELFMDPLNPPSSGSKMMTTGVNHDTLSTCGVLDLRKGAQILHVPAITDRYYSVQFTDLNNVSFAYVGTRTTGSQAGDYLITGPGWKGEVPVGMAQIRASKNSVLIIGRTLVKNDSDLPAAYALAKQIELIPLQDWFAGK
jgi:hypothetical protein